MSFLEILKNKGFTQQSLCNHLQKKNLYKYQQQISEWCRGIRVPDLISVYYLSEILNVSIQELTVSLLKGANLI